jgi:TadE-like protein
MNIRRILRQLRSTNGAEIAEVALVLPLVFTFLLGIIWFGRAFNIYSTITQAAQQGAITAARASCATCGDGPNSDATVDNAVYALMRASSIDTTKIPASAKPALPACPSPPAPAGGTCKSTGNNIWVCRNMWLNSAFATQAPQCGTVVSFTYPFQLSVPFTSVNQILLSAHAQSRMEN